jgi:hypothetical protein
MYSFYDFMQAGGTPNGTQRSEPDGSMALGQIDAAIDKLQKLRQFIQPESDLEPWVSSKLTLMDHYTDAVSDYMMYNPEAQGEEMEMMRGGGYVVTRSNDRKGKTHKVTGPDGTVKYFGDSKLGQHPKDPERKKAFYARHKKNLEGNPYFRAFARATWADGGQIQEMKGGGSTFSGNAWYQDGGELPQAGDGWIVPAAIGALALGTTMFANNKRKQIGEAMMPMMTGAGGMMEDGGELPMAGFGMITPGFFNNLSEFITNRQQLQQQKQPPAINYNPNQQAYGMSMIGSGMMSVGQPQGAQLTGATSANPFAWQSFSQTAAPVNPNQPKQFEQQKADNPIFGDVTKLQKTLKEGSAKDVRAGVKQFNQTYGSNLKVPFGFMGNKGRENMEKFGNLSSKVQMGIGIGSAATDLFINNPRIKKENQQRQIMAGMTDSLYMPVPDRDRGDWVAAGSRIGELRPDQYVVNKGMYTGQFFPTMNMMETGGGVIDEALNMPLELVETSMPTYSTSPETSSSPKATSARKSSGANPIAEQTWDEISSEFEGVKHLGIWGDKRHQKTKSDHNTGDALDIGIKSKEQGEQIAQKLLREAAERNIKYVIWNRQIWNPSVSNQWRPYNGDNPHDTHVHVSFNRNQQDLGQISLTHNNPLNIHHGNFSANYGGKQGAKDGDGYVSIFPDVNTGIKAAKDLLFGPNYSNFLVSEARNKWVSGNPNTPNSSTSHIVKAMGGNKRLNQLTEAEKELLIKEFAKWEGRQAYNKIKDMKLFADGGSLSYAEGDVYELTEDEIRSILSSGGNVEFL